MVKVRGKMLDTNSTGLLVIDVQGNLARGVGNANQFASKVNQLIRAAQIMSLPIICMEQMPHKLGATIDEVKQLLGDTKVYTKSTFDGLKNPDIEDAIANASCSHWLVCGIEAHVCVYQTVVGLLDYSYTVEVVSDAVSSRDQGNKNLAISRMQQAGAKITSVEMALFELIGDADTHLFKQILPIIK
jgi:nicotinamidase-related amidase